MLNVHLEKMSVKDASLTQMYSFLPASWVGNTHEETNVPPIGVMVENPPIPFSPFSLTDCTMLSHFSFDDFVAIAFWT